MDKQPVFLIPGYGLTGPLSAEAAIKLLINREEKSCGRRLPANWPAPLFCFCSRQAGLDGVFNLYLTSQ